MFGSDKNGQWKFKIPPYIQILYKLEKEILIRMPQPNH